MIALSLETVVDGVLVAMAAAMLLSFVRLVLGPSLLDRVVALDVLSMIAVGFTFVYAIRTDEAVLVDVGIAMALLAFLATVAFARYVYVRPAEGEGE